MLISSRYSGFVTSDSLLSCSSFMELGVGPAASFPQQMLRCRFCPNQVQESGSGIADYPFWAPYLHLCVPDQFSCTSAAPGKLS